MEAIALSEKVSVRPVNSYGHVKFIRTKVDGTRKAVYFPGEWISSVMDACSRIMLDSSETCKFKNWELDRCLHNGVQYVQLDFIDATGDRIG